MSEVKTFGLMTTNNRWKWVEQNQSMKAVNGKSIEGLKTQGGIRKKMNMKKIQKLKVLEKKPEQT